MHACETSAMRSELRQDDSLGELRSERVGRTVRSRHEGTGGEKQPALESASKKKSAKP